MNADVLRVGIVGAGRNTREKHIPGLRALAGVEVVSVCNRSRELSEKCADLFDIPTVYDHWLELVQAPDTDAIVIGTWPYRHAPITLAALAADKHVLCEARMAMNAAEAQAMVAAAQANPHLTAQLVPSPFTLQVDLTVKRLISEGYLGDILAIEVREESGFIDFQAPLHWREDKNLSGLNVMGLGIWYEALMRWVGEATQVMAMGEVFTRMRQDPGSGEMRAVQIPDHLDVTAKMACGAQAHFGLSRVKGFRKTIELSLFGSQGNLWFAEGELLGGRRGDQGMQEIVILPAEAGQWRVEAEFVNAIRGIEKIKLTTFEDGLKYMRFTEAVARSMAEGRAVMV